MKKLYVVFVILSVLFFTATIVAQPSFTPKTDFRTGDLPRSVSIGDLNGDGKPDMAVANSGMTTVSILLNTTPPGALTPTFTPKTDFTTGSGPLSVSIGDFNGDGKPDLAVANVYSVSVSVLLNTTTTGSLTPTYTPKADFTTGSNPNSVSIGDVNGDGKPDLVVANLGSNTVSVFLNTTVLGASTPTFTAKTDFATGGNPNSVSIGDVNGDLKPDLAVADGASSMVSVLLNLTAQGSSTPSFTARTDFATGLGPTSVSIGDFNGDLKPDLAVTNGGPLSASIFLNTTAQGASIPSFSARTDFTTGSGPQSVAIGDLDGDLKPDLAVTNFIPTAVSVFLNLTPSGATTPSFSAKTDFTTGSSSFSVSIGDLNGDGKPDLAVANEGSNTVSVLLNLSGQTDACITWNLLSSDSVTSVTGNINGQLETIGVGSSSPFMSVYLPYSSGQKLWVGNTGWVAGPLDPMRYVEFNASPNPGNNFTVTNVSFNYGDFPLGTDFSIINFKAYYSTDNWMSSTVLNSTGLVYLNTTMQSFTRAVSVPVPNSTTFSLRIYPYALLNGIAMTPTFAIHNNVLICGTTTPVVLNTGSICGMKFNDVNGNGVKDTGEPGLPGWRIGLNTATIPPVTTDSLGNYCFNNLPAGTYTVAEINQTGWQQTAPPSPGTYGVVLAAGQGITGLDFGNQYDSAQACIRWDLLSTDSVTSTIGNINGQPETMGVGSSSPFMSVYLPYSSGQKLWVGNTGWVAGPLDPMRYVEFNASPNPGNNFTVTNVSFNYGDFPLGTDFSIINFKAYYSTDNWMSSTVLNSTGLVYLNTTMQSFTRAVSVPVPNSTTFSLRIYPYALLNGIAMTPTFAIHSNVTICGTTTSVTGVHGSRWVPEKFELMQCYPNPFNPTTTIRYDIPKMSFVKLSVYDILGREIRVLVHEEKSPGHHEIIFDAKEFASGIYFYTIRTGDFTQSKKMILSK